jgi:hypothetical protein
MHRFVNQRLEPVETLRAPIARGQHEEAVCAEYEPAQFA